jgi:hypothetical protein
MRKFARENMDSMNANSLNAGHNIGKGLAKMAFLQENFLKMAFFDPWNPPQITCWSIKAAISSFGMANAKLESIDAKMHSFSSWQFLATKISCAFLWHFGCGSRAHFCRIKSSTDSFCYWKNY